MSAILEIGKFVFDNRVMASLLSGEPDTKARRIMHQATGAALKRAGQHLRTNLTRLISAESWLKKKAIRSNIKKLRLLTDHYGDLEAQVVIHSGLYAANQFKMFPNRVTIRKAKSTSWTTPSVQVGPSEPARLFDRENGFSKAWIGLDRAGKKQMFHRNLSTGRLEPVQVASLNYFASFDRVRNGAFKGANEVFEKRIWHEVQYRLGILK